MHTKDILLIISLGIVVSIAFPVSYHPPSHTQVMVKDKKFAPMAVNYSEKYNYTFYCSICEFLINHGEEYITKSTSEIDAINFLEHICTLLPKSMLEECDEFIRDNYLKLKEFIIEKESAHSVCTQLYFCKEYEHNVNDCDFCKYATLRIERFLSNNVTLSEIIGYGNIFCNNYPQKYVQVCNNFIPFYYSQVIGKLVDQQNFVEVCNNLAICKHIYKLY